MSLLHPESAMTFVDQDGRQITFKYMVEQGTQLGYIQRIISVAGGTPQVDKLTDTRVVNITDLQFNIQGLPKGTDVKQPLVVLSIKGVVINPNGAGQEFVIQSSVSQRIIDEL